MPSRNDLPVNGPTVALDTLGCKLNQAEMEDLALRLAQAGLRLVGPEQPADVYVLNTCTVTHVADRKSRQMVRRARRSNPDALVVVAGCYAQNAQDRATDIDGADLVVPNDAKSGLADLILERCRLPFPESGPTAGCSATPDGLRTRAMVKVQDGCNMACSYCIVPSVRGPERSAPPDQIIAAVRDRVKRGYKEVTLTGTRIGSYGCDGGSDIVSLVQRVLCQTGIERLRLTSLQPQDLSPELLGLWQDPRLCRHLHLPLQSGSNAVLRRMRRPYTTGAYARAVDAARRALPDVSITADVIVGFPGETDDEFEQSVEFCREMRFAALHVFPYSARPGTPAAGMKGRVAEAVKAGRVRRMLALARGSARAFRERMVGQTCDVLMEERNDGHWAGLTGNYVRVFAASEQPLHNQIVAVTLTSNSVKGIMGVISS